MEVKVGLATWSASEGGFKARRGKTHVVKVKSNAVRDDIIAEAVKKHASFIRVLTAFLHTFWFILTSEEFISFRVQKMCLFYQNTSKPFVKSLTNV